MKWRFAVLTATICASLLLLHSEVRGSTYAEFYFVSGADGSGFFCMTNGLHDQYHAFDLTKYGGNACIHTGNGNLGDAVAVRTAGYTASGTATLRSSWYTGEYADLCDYAYGGLTSIADGLARGTVRYIHS